MSKDITDVNASTSTAERNATLKEQVQTKELQNQLDALSPTRLMRLTSAAGQVTAAIEAGTDVVNAVSGLKDAVMKLYGSFEGAKAFADRHRTLELLVINLTKHRLVWENSFFDSGTTFAGPMPLNIAPIGETGSAGAGLWTVANGQGSLMTGVSGAGKWQIEGTRFALVVGFTNPQFGSLKSAIGIVGRDAAAEIAYAAAEDANAKQYDTFGYTVWASADEAKAGGDRRFIFCIAENAQASEFNHGDVLKCGEYLAPGHFLLSRNSRYAASYQADRGQLAVYDLTGLRDIIWSSGSSRATAWRCELDAAGQFVIREEEAHTAWSAPATAPGGHVQLTDDGALRLVDRANNLLWATR